MAPVRVTSSLGLRVQGSRPGVIVRVHSYDNIGSITTYRVAAAQACLVHRSRLTWQIRGAEISVKLKQRVNSQPRHYRQSVNKRWFSTKSINAIKSALLRHELFVFKVDSSIDDERLREFIISEHVALLEIERMSKEGAWTQSFRVLVTATNSKIIAPWAMTSGPVASDADNTTGKDRTQGIRQKIPSWLVMYVINTESLAAASYHCDD